MLWSDSTVLKSYLFNVDSMILGKYNLITKNFIYGQKVEIKFLIL